MVKNTKNSVGSTACILPHLNESNASSVFSKKMMKLWIQCLANRSNSCHDLAVDFGKELIEKYDEYDASLQEIIITLLTEDPGAVNFDEITSSSIVNQLYIKTKPEAVDALVSRTIEKIKNYQALSSRDRMRTLLVCQLRDLLKSSHLSESSEIKLKVLKFLLTHGYFDVSKVKSLKLCTPATGDLIDKIKIIFFKIISATGNKLEILESLGLFVLRLLKSDVPLKDEKNLSLWKKVKKMKKQFLSYKHEEKYDKQLSIFKPLIYGIAISSFQDTADLNALTNDFEELVECFARSLGENSEDNEPEWPDVLFDMMISRFTSHSVFLSSMMIRVFKLIVSDISLKGVEQLKIALLTDKFEDDEVEEEENADEADDLSDSDGEEVDIDDEEPDDVDDEFRSKVILALGPAAEIGDDSGTIFDDEEMLQLDEALAEVFRSKYSKDANIQETLKTLRARCLELVKIIFKSRDVSFEVILHIVPVLIDAMMLYYGSKDGEMINKAAKILTQLPMPKKFQQTVDFDILESILKKTVDLVSKFDVLAVQRCAARLYIWTVSIGKRIGKDIDFGLANLEKLLADFFVKPNSCASKDFFLIIFQNLHVYNSKLVETICEHVFGNLRPFKKIGGLSLLNTYLRCFNKEIMQDNETKSLLKSTRKKCFAGLMSAVNAKKNLLINEYLILLFLLSGIISLNLTPEEIATISSMNRGIKANLSKAGRLARKKILSSVSDTMMQPENYENQGYKEIAQNGQSTEKNEKMDISSKETAKSWPEAVDVVEKKSDPIRTMDDVKEKESDSPKTFNDKKRKSYSPKPLHDVVEKKSDPIRAMDDVKEQESDSPKTINDVKKRKSDCHKTLDDIEEKKSDSPKTLDDIEEKKSDSSGSKEGVEKQESESSKTIKDVEEKKSDSISPIDDFEEKKSESLKTMEVDTPIRITRSKAKRLKVVEEHSEADEEMANFSIPRCAAVETPLRRSLRNRNATKM